MVLYGDLFIYYDSHFGYHVIYNEVDKIIDFYTNSVSLYDISNELENLLLENCEVVNDEDKK